jgi:two-component system, NarL family, sensor histidine kinase DesK
MHYFERRPIRDDQDFHARPWVSLPYLAFVYLPLVFWDNRPWSAIVASLVATALFLPAYFASYRVLGWRQAALIAFVAGIAFALIPFNPGGNTFVIYAMAMSAATLPARTAIA